jgi:hypothetical protein
VTGWSRPYSETFAPFATPLGFVLYAPRFLPNSRMQTTAFEPEELSCVQERLRTSDRLIDVGANVGWYTCVTRAAGRPALAIEAQRANLECLYQTLLANGWSDTEVLAMGVGDVPGIRVLYGAPVQAPP